MLVNMWLINDKSVELTLIWGEALVTFRQISYSTLARYITRRIYASK